ncbi:MAG: hypothetical protein ACR2ID_10960 [Chthoniobacterales bacterium]
MKRLSRPRRAGERGQVIVLLVIVLATVGGIAWWLFATRAASEKAARDFAHEAGLKLGREFDRKFLDVRIGSEVQTRFPSSFRDRLIDHLKRLGVASEEVEVEGDLTFTDRFFKPHGAMKVHLLYPDGMKAVLYLSISNPHGWWQFDYLNLAWYPPGQTAPAEGSEPPSPATVQ